MKTAIQLTDEINYLKSHIDYGVSLAKQGYDTDMLNAGNVIILEQLKEQLATLMKGNHMKVIELNQVDMICMVIEETDDAYLIMPDMIGKPPERVLKTKARVVADFTVFYSRYENKWDYTMNVYDRGLSLGRFIEEKRQDHRWMFDQKQPSHISEVPEAIRQEYIDFLAQELADEWALDIKDLNYTELDAAIGDYESYTWELEQEEA